MTTEVKTAGGQADAKEPVKPTPSKAVVRKTTRGAADELWEMAKHFRAKGFIQSARGNLEAIPEPLRVNKHWHSLAEVYHDLGWFDDASAACNRINESLLTENGLHLYLKLKGKLAVAQGHIAEAKKYVQLRRAFFVEQSLAATVELFQLTQHESPDEIDRFAAVLLRARPEHMVLVEVYAQFLFEQNRLSELDAFLCYYGSRFRRSHKLFMLKANLAWIRQDEIGLETAFEIAQREMPYSRPFAEFVQRYRTQIPAAEEIAQDMRDSLLSADINPKLQSVDDTNRAWMLQVLEDNDAAIEKLDAIIDSDDFPILALLVRGLAHFANGDSQSSRADLLEVVKQAPRQLLAYRILLQIGMEQYPDTSFSDEVIALRNNHNPQFTQAQKDGRLGFYDVEFGQTLWFKGKYYEGYRAKIQKQTCSYLAAKFPAQYNVYEMPRMSDLDHNSVLILGDDGVGDELRYAYAYANLPETTKAVITCEPRLHGLLSRSFPQHEFVPVIRRWPDLPIKIEDDRADIDNGDFARIITSDLFKRIPDFDRLRFQQDILAAGWLENDIRAPALSGAGDGAFIVPDANLVKQCKNYFNSETGTMPETLKVGLIWRSGLVNARRAKQYLLVEQLKALLEVGGVDFFSLQHDLTDDERDFCAEHGVSVRDDIDWRGDFETVAAFTSHLDYVIGISSSSFEIAASVGTECWLIGASPEALGLRLGDSDQDRDRITWNTTVIRPSAQELDDAREQQKKWPKEAAVYQAAIKLAALVQEPSTPPDISE